MVFIKNPLSVPRLAVNQFTSMPLSFREDVQLLRQLNVAEVEICERKLDSSARERECQLEEFFEAQLRPCSIQPKVHSIFPDRLAPEPKEPEARLASYRQAIDWAAQTFPGQTFPFILIGGAAPGYNLRHANAEARRLIPELADYAADRGFRIAFEPVHPVLMNLDTFIWAWEDAIRLVDAVDRPNVGLVLDVWHVWQEHGIVERIPAAAERIWIVHLSDWPKQAPRSLDDRLVPGDGVIPLPAILGALESAHYSGPYCIEILSDKSLPDSLWKQNPKEIISRAQENFARSWEQIDSSIGPM